MRKFSYCLCLLLSSLLANAMEPPQHEGEISVGDEYSVHSDILEEKQFFRISLPRSYAGTGGGVHFPVIYVLDGHEDQFRAVTAAVRANSLFGSRMPEAIVVGVPSNMRQRDYTPHYSAVDYFGKPSPKREVSGGGLKYREYLKGELFPLIESLYRTNGYRILVGHSLGASFALYDLMREDSLFQAYIAVDPNLWGGDWYLGKMAEAAGTHKPEFQGSLFLPYVPRPDEMPRAAAELAKIENGIKSIAVSDDSIALKPFTDENHQSILPISYHEGLRFTFRGYEPPPLEAVAHNPTLLINHFEAYSKRMGVRYLPDPTYINNIAYSALHDYKLLDNALILYELNVEYYPERSYSWGALGYYHEQVGNVEEAVKAARKSVELDPSNIWSKERIERLSN